MPKEALSIPHRFHTVTIQLHCGYASIALLLLYDRILCPEHHIFRFIDYLKCIFRACTKMHGKSHFAFSHEKTREEIQSPTR
jgi:hypothetical protein